MSRISVRALGVARTHGLFDLVGGAWPIAWRRSFECAFGPKEEEWLQKTSGGLFIPVADDDGRDVAGIIDAGSHDDGEPELPSSVW